MTTTTVSNAKFFAISANNVVGLFRLICNTKKIVILKTCVARIPEESYIYNSTT